MSTANIRNLSSDALLTLAAGDLTCAIAHRGAELRSLRQADDEFIWQRDPAWWPGAAPILFPLIGRLKDERYTHHGREYRIAKHGFARDLPFTVESFAGHRATFTLEDSAETRAAWPFAFRLAVSFTLDAHGLSVNYAVENRSEAVMPFALGSHPAFALPLGPLEAWRVRFAEVESASCHRMAANLLSSAREPFAFENDRDIPLSAALFERDALIFRGVRSRRIELIHDTRGPRLDFDTGGAPTLALWAKPGAPYVCFEPWWGLDDTSETNVELAAKPGLLRLHAGARFNAGYSVRPG
ncbi:MAG: aldose 1-epimerase family protein [Betaproteobacteria bacterium]|nr:aldose 1-epimerase family protein [Betaproteobacteria bacterium]